MGAGGDDGGCLVRVRGLGKSYPVSPFHSRRVLEGIDLEIPTGAAVALVGPSGSGKSTLLRLLLGLIPPSEGSVRIRGLGPAEALSRVRAGYLPEDQGLPPGLTGDETVALHAGMTGESGGATRERLTRLGLLPDLPRRVSTYSHGMKVRLALGVALAGRPDLLVLDEPFSGLDPALRLLAHRELKEYVEQGGALVVSSHLLTDLAGLVSRVIILLEGKLRRDVAAEEVFLGRPEEWFVEQVAVARP